jgi:hypothetical protein
MLLADDDDIDDDADDEDDAKAEDDRLKKEKGHVSTLAPIEPSGSWCDAPQHH